LNAWFKEAANMLEESSISSNEQEMLDMHWDDEETKQRIRNGWKKQKQTEEQKKNQATIKKALTSVLAGVVTSDLNSDLTAAFVDAVNYVGYTQAVKNNDPKAYDENNDPISYRQFLKDVDNVYLVRYGQERGTIAVADGMSGGLFEIVYRGPFVEMPAAQKRAKANIREMELQIINRPRPGETKEQWNKRVFPAIEKYEAENSNGKLLYSPEGRLELSNAIKQRQRTMRLTVED
jgi:hypothetical protein